MKHNTLGLLAVVLAGSFLFAGCAPRRTVAVYAPPPVLTPTGQTYVVETPPEPKREVVGVAPSTGQVWVPGYWAHSNARWVWIPGHWTSPPQPQAAWVPGHWSRTAGGWVWTPGHWQ